MPVLAPKAEKHITSRIRTSSHAADTASSNFHSKRSHPIDTLSLSVPIAGADLFAGAGGFSKAAQNIGIEIKVAVEFDRHACSTYRHNFATESGGPSLLEGDINTISLSSIGKHFSSERSCELVLGGPPCQGFSVHRINGAGVSDPRNRLIHRYFEVVKALQPKIFLLENVPGILWDRHAEYLELFYKVSNSAGFRVHAPVVLDASDYGVPQRRKRVFILGIDENLPEIQNWPPKATHGDAKACKADSSLLPHQASAIAFHGAEKTDINDVHMQHGAELKELFRNTPLNGGSRKDSGRTLPCHEKHNGHKDVYGRIDSRKVAPTMTTACVNPSRGRFVHPTQNHGITVRQAARIQTFPDDFVFLGGIMAASKQIGNAVPVKMGEALLLPIRDFLLANR
jgi:DNA (cytosine-5)-methyltransferase 1